MLNREAYANYFPESFRAAVKLQGLSSLFFTNGRLVILQQPENFSPLKAVGLVFHEDKRAFIRGRRKIN